MKPWIKRELRDTWRIWKMYWVVIACGVVVSIPFALIVQHYKLSPDTPWMLWPCIAAALLLSWRVIKWRGLDKPIKGSWHDNAR